MCGFAGFLDITAATPDRGRVVAAMADTLVHRGPDDCGVWSDDDSGIALGFRRLAILDLSPHGHQPMASHDGRWVVSFNGEIYNHGQLRDRLDAVSWRGRSDTEVLLEAVSRWGVERTLALCDGMFAIALWDRLEHTLYLARDRIGEKPLYWSENAGTLMFASELKALAVHPAFDPALDRDALAAKLPPGTVMTVKGGSRSIRPYWSAVERARAVAGSFTGGAAAAAERLNQLLRSSVALRMQADVPVGVFLSGGVDSSVTAAIMQELSPQPVHSFTIAFDAAGYDESPHARAVAQHIGTRHVEVPISDDDALALVPRLPHIWDEPFADPSMVPTALLCRAVAGVVTVCLSGDGGDELFAGYPRYKAVALAALLQNAPDLVAAFELLPFELPLGVRIARAQAFAGEAYPVVLKPDIGSRGRGVAVIRDEAALIGYLQHAPGDVLVQRYVGGEEYGLFVYRAPDDGRPVLYSITHKCFPRVLGDGRRTLVELIAADPRARLIAPLLWERFAARRLQERTAALGAAYRDRRTPRRAVPRCVRSGHARTATRWARVRRDPGLLLRPPRFALSVGSGPARRHGAAHPKQGVTAGAISTIRTPLHRGYASINPARRLFRDRRR